MTPDPQLLFWICCVITVVSVVVIAARVMVWLRRLATTKSEPEHRCKCGYIVANLKMPRCPECGCAIGFNKSFAELGIDEKDVRRHVESQAPTQAKL